MAIIIKKGLFKEKKSSVFERHSFQETRGQVFTMQQTRLRRRGRRRRR